MEKTFSIFEHGGGTRTGLRKIARPFRPGCPVHLTMRAPRARGSWSFLAPAHKGIVHLLVLDTAERYDIELIEWQNVGNHLHLAVRARARTKLQAFLRVLPQRIAVAVTGVGRNRQIGRFWEKPAHTRVLQTDQELKTVREYIWKNRLEALGFSPKQIAVFRRNASAVPLI